MNNFETIKELVSKSDLPFNEQIDFITIFTNSKDEDLESIAQLFSGNAVWINKINDNFKAKNAALRAGDAELWKKILEEEKKELEKIEEQNG